ncbi:MAG: hypothetical protein L6R38_002525 [Xanthoria sp. 2 TBL-2021]|nr:MAG: hypothetical protein L6R38_002525 [Xanthoria sp. 2 TBL-2021]
MSSVQNSDRDSEGSNEEEASLLLPRLGHDGEQNISRSDIGGPKIPLIERRQSSISRQPPDGLPRKPRTPNRVRFEVEEHSDGESATNSRPAESDEEDYLPHDTSIGQRRENAQRAPLLTGIEAPSVTVASTDFDLDAEHLLDISRPKSGMRSAFMNMANSIMYVSPIRPTWNR